MVSQKTLLLLTIGLLATVQSASAVVLDWSGVSWSSGSLSNTYDVDGDGSDDITIAISDGSSAMVTGYPAISTALEGGQGSGTDALELRTDFSNASQTITVTVTFLNDYVGATDVSFSLFDIDAKKVGASKNYRFRDYLDQISATGDAGLVAPTVTGSSANSVAGTGTGQNVTGNSLANDTGTGSGNGDVTIDFGTNQINNFTFTFGNTGSILAGNPQEQSFAIYDINFKKSVPETGTTFAALLLCGLLPLFRHLQQRRVRRLPCRPRR